MKILVFSWRDPRHPLAGGAEQVMHEHMKGWLSQGHTVTLFSSQFPGSKKTETIDGVKILRSGNQILGVHLRAFLWYCFKKHDEYALIIDQFHGLPFFTPLYIHKKIIAVIQEVAGNVWLENPFRFPLNKIVGYLGFWLEPLFFVPYRRTAFITGSESAKSDLLKVGIKSKFVTIIPHGVIVKHPQKKIHKEKIPTVMFLGALTKDKGIEDALKAFQILQNKGHQYHFWVAGKGDPQFVDYLQNKYTALNNLTFFGFVSLEKKFELLSKACLLINPSVREGWGLVNIEANACQTPVVAYHSPGLIDSVKHNTTGIVCKKNTPDNLAHEIEKLINDRRKYHLLQKNALAWSKEFTWDKSKARSIALLENL